ncbi:hypothetical protein E2C01_036049 [Portunus trituberculatus]|uniref:Uncharacterized protein n=1 Tax=Portunus trituberculatus TaxID=210409 RepID=A0A5B7FA55_PORTR|nr:hypothetical protein [Portunus trituberculatus]
MKTPHLLNNEGKSINDKRSEHMADAYIQETWIATCDAERCTESNFFLGKQNYTVTIPFSFDRNLLPHRHDRCTLTTTCPLKVQEE